MRPLLTAGVALVAAAHLAFLAYLVGGGFLALALRGAHRRWSRLALGAHAASAAWAAGSVTWDLWCPLTALERRVRAAAGIAPLPPEGFIDHYLTGVLFPASATGWVQSGVFAAIGVSWLAYAMAARRGRPPSHQKSVS